MFRTSDIFILAATAVSLIFSSYLWFTGNQSEGIYTAIWVPSILCVGIYLKLIGHVQSHKKG